MLLIIGMRNNRCRERIAQALEAVEGVSEADVSLHRGHATVVHEPVVTPEALAKSVARVGYAADHTSESDGGK